MNSISPLQIFYKTAKYLEARPMDFWSAKLRQEVLSGVGESVNKLLSVLEKKYMQDTQAFRQLKALEGSLGNDKIDEVKFTQNLFNLVELYSLSPYKKDQEELIYETFTILGVARKKIIEYHLLLESLEKKSSELSPEEIDIADLDTLQKVGVFYVLEYTLQVLHEWPNLSVAGQKELLNQGLATNSGNLPAFLPLAESFRKEVCFKIYNNELRKESLTAFYEFEGFCSLSDVDIDSFGPALKKLNLQLLHLFKNHGLVIYKAMVYSTFGSDTPMDQVIEQVEQIQV